MLAGVFEDADPDADPAAVAVNEMNRGPLSMGNGLTRLQTRFFGDADGLAAVEKHAGEMLQAEDAEQLGLVTFAPDDIGWAEEVRMAVEERSSFSPESLTGIGASYPFARPDDMDS